MMEILGESLLNLISFLKKKPLFSMTLGQSPSDYPERVRICKEMGVTACVTAPNLNGIGRDQYAAAMQKQKDEWADVGFTLPVYETMTIVSGQHIRRGTPGREEELLN